VKITFFAAIIGTKKLLAVLLHVVFEKKKKKNDGVSVRMHGCSCIQPSSLKCKFAVDCQLIIFHLHSDSVKPGQSSLLKVASAGVAKHDHDTNQAEQAPVPAKRTL
jgi:hypothetical protein